MCVVACQALTIKGLMCCLAGRELDLRRFHEAIEECGGFDAAVSNKKFGRIAVKLGIDLAVATNAAYLLKYVLFVPVGVRMLLLGCIGAFDTVECRFVNKHLWLQVSLSAFIGALPANGTKGDRHSTTCTTRRARWGCHAD